MDLHMKKETMFTLLRLHLDRNTTICMDKKEIRTTERTNGQIHLPKAVRCGYDPLRQNHRSSGLLIIYVLLYIALVCYRKCYI